MVSLLLLAQPEQWSLSPHTWVGDYGSLDSVHMKDGVLYSTRVISCGAWFIQLWYCVITYTISTPVNAALVRMFAISAIKKWECDSSNLGSIAATTLWSTEGPSRDKSWTVDCCFCTGWDILCLGFNVLHAENSYFYVFKYCLCSFIKRTSFVLLDNADMFQFRHKLFWLLLEYCYRKELLLLKGVIHSQHIPPSPLLPFFVVFDCFLCLFVLSKHLKFAFCQII